MSSPNQVRLSFTRKLKRTKALGKDQGKSITEIAGKAKIEGDKLPKITN